MSTDNADTKDGCSVTPVVEKMNSSQLERGTEAVTIDPETNRALLKRIDRRVMPVVC